MIEDIRPFLILDLSLNHINEKMILLNVGILNEV